MRDDALRLLREQIESLTIDIEALELMRSREDEDATAANALVLVQKQYIATREAAVKALKSLE